MERQDGNSEFECEQQNLRWFLPSFVFVEIIGITIIGLSIGWLGYYNEGFSWTASSKTQFNYHPVLMLVAMVFLYANAILIYRVFRNERKKTVKLSHGFIHCLVFLTTVIALQAVFQSHNRDAIPNMYSFHSWLGISTVLIFTLQLLAGFISFLFPGLRMNLRARYLPIHVFFGLACFLLAVATALTGIMEKAWFKLGSTYSSFPSEGILINCLALLLVLFAFVVTFLIVNSDYKRRPLPEEQMPLVSQHHN